MSDPANGRKCDPAKGPNPRFPPGPTGQEVGDGGSEEPISDGKAAVACEFSEHVYRVGLGQPEGKRPKVDSGGVAAHQVQGHDQASFTANDDHEISNGQTGRKIRSWHGLNLVIDCETKLIKLCRPLDLPGYYINVQRESHSCISMVALSLTEMTEAADGAATSNWLRATTIDPVTSTDPSDS